jgi:hypothetical protein
MAVHVRRLSILRTLPSQDHLQRRHLHRSKELVVRAGMSLPFRRSDIRMDLVGILATNGGLLWSNARSFDGGSGCGLQNDRHEWASMASGIQLISETWKSGCLRWPELSGPDWASGRVAFVSPAFTTGFESFGSRAPNLANRSSLLRFLAGPDRKSDQESAVFKVGVDRKA